MILLGIESSCDETAASVVEMSETRRQVLSDCVATQVPVHALYGGVVPEIASRAHTEAVSGLTYEALREAGISLSQVDAIAVTSHPGLIGALLVGVNFAKSLAYANSIPLVPVQHLRGHVAANYLAHPTLEPPFIALVVSGGHTTLFNVPDPVTYEVLGGTRDDAMGEAFDKAARVMGIPYPGGAEMDRLASLGDKKAIRFPSAAIPGDELDFSFSGLKTAVINYLHTAEMKGLPVSREDVAASFTETVVSSALKKVDQCVKRYRPSRIVLAGGVSANSHLRTALADYCAARGIGFFVPPRHLCSDNASMIAAQGYYEYLAGVRGDVFLNASPLD